MAKEEKNTSDKATSEKVEAITGLDPKSVITESLDLEALEQSVNETNQQMLASEKENKQSMKDILTDLQSVTADKAVLSDSFNALENISFKDLIGKPLQAAIEAQADAAKSTLDFVKGLCVKGADGSEQVAVVSFEFFKNGKKARINLPLLSLVNIPSLEIKSMTYHFTAKIDSHSSLIVTHNSGSTANSKSVSSGTSEETPKANEATGATGEEGKKDQAQSKKTSDETAKATDKDTEAKDDKKDDKKAENKTENKGETKSDSQNATNAIATAATDPKANVTKDTTFSASYTQPSTTATKDSKYAVQTTMDISITVEPNEIPGGIKTMLSILDGAIEVINPNGELSISHQQVVLQNGYAIITASYRDPDGLCAPGDITCKGSDKSSAPQVMLNADTAKIIFTKPGMYTITAGKVSEPVFVVGAVETQKETTDENKS